MTAMISNLEISTVCKEVSSDTSHKLTCPFSRIDEHALVYIVLQTVAYSAKFKVNPILDITLSVMNYDEKK